MRPLSCGAAQERLAGRRAGWSTAESLELEAHLGDCERCQADAAALDGILGALEHLPERVLDDAARDRALSAGLDLAGSARSPASRGGSARWLAAAAVLLCAAGGFALLRGNYGGDSPGERFAAGRVVSGDVLGSAAAVLAGSELPSGTTVEVVTAGELALGRARVHADPGTRLRWDGPSEEVSLEAGRIAVQVAHRDAGRFVVSTERFSVEVTGTRFSVNLQGVRVQEGSVRVRNPAGDVLVMLTAGDTFSVADPGGPQPMPEAELDDSSKGSPAATKEAHVTEAVLPAQGGGVTHEAAEEPTAPAPGMVLSRARNLIAQRKHSEAVRRLKRLLTRPLRRAERAEAEMLLGDNARVAGRMREAARRYGAVARRFGRLAAGRQALFAAAQAEAAIGRRARSRALLRTYLTEYPDGALVPEARRALKALRSSQ